MPQYAVRFATIAVAWTLTAVVYPQVQKPAPQNPPSLQQLYARAQSAQSAGNLDDAAVDYRAFLTTGLEELGSAFALAQDYRQSTKLLDEALQIDRNVPGLALQYARISLMSGDLPRAESFSRELIQQRPNDRAVLSSAHQVLGRVLLKTQRDAEARKEFELATSLDPTFQNGYDLAVACLDLADEPCAAQVFKEMQTAFGDTAELHVAFGKAYADSDFQPKAVGEFDRAIQQEPRRPGTHYLLAAVLLASGGGESSQAAAEKNLHAELLISPDDAMTYAALGQIALTRNDLPEAIGYLQKAIAFGPDLPEGYLYLGQAYFNSGRMSEAETALQTCVRLTTDPARNRYQVQKAHYLLGRLLMKRGQADAAHAEMNIARELADKTLAHDKGQLAGLMDQASSASSVTDQNDRQTGPDRLKLDEAALQSARKRSEQLRPAIADSYNNLGAIAASRTDFVGAVRDFGHAAVWEPALDGLDYNWGRAAFAGSLYADAIAPLTRYVAAHPEDQGALSVLGISKFMTHDFKGCISTLAPIASAGTLAPEVDYAYSVSLVETGQIGDGEERLKRLMSASPGSADLHRALGEAYGKQGQWLLARQQLQLALASNPRDAMAYLQIGKVDLASGAIDVGIGELQNASRLSPDDKEVHQVLAGAYTAAHRLAEAEQELEISRSLHAKK